MQRFPDIPDYKIIRELGRGGMAHVYLALQLSLQREEAVKVMSRNLDDLDSIRHRFLREARTMARLIHRNIVSVYNIRDSDSLTFMSMEHLPGGTLADRVARGLSVSESVSVVAQIAAALQAAHDEGVIHRDLKPDNILFRADGTPVLTDFGIAKEQDANHTSITQTGMFIGTPNYMSPEQIRGKRVDGRSDLYSLGIVLYELLRGRRPFIGDSAMGVMLMHVNEMPEPLPEHLTDFQPVIDRMLAKEPDERYASCTVFTHEFRRVVMHSQTLWPMVHGDSNSSVSEQLRVLGFSGAHTLPGSKNTTLQDAIEDAGDSSVVRPGDRENQTTEARDATVQISLESVRTAQIGSIRELIPPSQIGVLLAREPLEAQDVSLAAAHMRLHLARGAGSSLRLQLLQRLTSQAESAQNLEQLENARYLLESAAAVLGASVDFADVQAEIDSRHDALETQAWLQAQVETHMAAARAAIGSRTLLPPDDDNAFHHLNEALALDATCTEARQLLNRLPSAIIRVAAAFTQRHQIEASRQLVERAARCFPDDAELARLLESARAQQLEEARCKAHAQRLQALAQRMRDDADATIRDALSALTTEGALPADSAEHLALLAAMEPWFASQLTSTNLEALDAGIRLLTEPHRDLGKFPDLVSRIEHLKEHHANLHAILKRERREAEIEARLAAAVTSIDTLFEKGPHGFLELIRAAGAEQFVMAITRTLPPQADAIGEMLREAVRSGSIQDAALDAWLAELSKITFMRSMLDAWQGEVAIERRVRTASEHTRQVLAEPLQAEPSLRQDLEELAALARLTSKHSALADAFKGVANRLGDDLAACETQDRLVALEKIASWFSVVAGTFGAAGSAAEATVQGHIGATRNRLREIADASTFAEATARLQLQQSPEALRLALETHAKLDAGNQDARGRVAALKAAAEQCLERALQQQQWDIVDEWLEAGALVFDAKEVANWQERRAQKQVAAHQAEGDRALAITQFEQQLATASNDATELARTVSQVRRLDYDRDVRAQPFAERLATRIVAAIAMAGESDLAVFEAILTPWQRLPIADVPVQPMLDALAARGRALARARDNLSSFIDVMTGGELTPMAAADQLLRVGKDVPELDETQWERVVTHWIKRASACADNNLLIEAREWVNLLSEPLIRTVPTQMLEQLDAKIDQASKAAAAASADATTVFKLPSLKKREAAASAKPASEPDLPASSTSAASSEPEHTPTADSTTTSDDSPPTLITKLPSRRVGKQEKRSARRTGSKPDTTGTSPVLEPVAPTPTAEVTSATPAAAPARMPTPHRPAIRSPTKPPSGRRIWPWLAAALVVSGILIAVLWPASQDERALAPEVARIDPELARVNVALEQAASARSLGAQLRALEAARSSSPAVRTNAELTARRTEQEARALNELERVAAQSRDAALSVLPRAQAILPKGERITRIATTLQKPSAEPAGTQIHALAALREHARAGRWFEPPSNNAWHQVQQVTGAQREELTKVFVESLSAAMVAMGPRDAAPLEQLLAQIDKATPLRDGLKTQIAKAKTDIATAAEYASLNEAIEDLRNGATPMRQALERGRALLQRPAGSTYADELESLLMPRLRQEVERQLAAQRMDAANALIQMALRTFPQTGAITELQILVEHATANATPAPVAVIGTGFVAIDATPWAEVESVTDSTGKAWPLPRDRSTPLRMELPAGAYRVALKHPAARASNHDIDVRRGVVTPLLEKFEVIDVDRILE